MYIQTGEAQGWATTASWPHQPFQLHFSKAMSHALPSSPEKALASLSLALPPPF